QSLLDHQVEPDEVDADRLVRMTPAGVLYGVGVHRQLVASTEERGALELVRDDGLEDRPALGRGIELAVVGRVRGRERQTAARADAQRRRSHRVQGSTRPRRAASKISELWSERKKTDQPNAATQLAGPVSQIVRAVAIADTAIPTKSCARNAARWDMT